MNQVVDYEERKRKIHRHCIPKFEEETCEVCHKPIGNISDLPPEIQEKVYRPGEDETYNVDVDFKGIVTGREIVTNGNEGSEIEHD